MTIIFGKKGFTLRASLEECAYRLEESVLAPLKKASESRVALAVLIITAVGLVLVSIFYAHPQTGELLRAKMRQPFGTQLKFSIVVTTSFVLFYLGLGYFLTTRDKQVVELRLLRKELNEPVYLLAQAQKLSQKAQVIFNAALEEKERKKKSAAEVNGSINKKQSKEESWADEEAIIEASAKLERKELNASVHNRPLQNALEESEQALKKMDSLIKQAKKMRSDHPSTFLSPNRLPLERILQRVEREKSNLKSIQDIAKKGSKATSF